MAEIHFETSSVVHDIKTYNPRRMKIKTDSAEIC